MKLPKRKFGFLHLDVRGDVAGDSAVAGEPSRTVEQRAGSGRSAPKRQAEDALTDRRLDPVFGQARIATINEALREPPHQAELTLELPQQQRARIRRDRAADQV
jgi:hypothetical protein